MPRFSIVMPTFRRQHVIRRAIESIREQTFVDWELIVVDNDGAGYRFDDPRILYFVYTAERGSSHARNFGIRAIRGELVAFFDDDDVMYPRYLETFDRVFQSPDVMMARCAMLTGRDGKTPDYSLATPEVVLRSAYATPTWEPTDCHDQKYFGQIVARNGWTDRQIVAISEVLVQATSDAVGGMRDPEGRF